MAQQQETVQKNWKMIFMKDLQQMVRNTGSRQWLSR